ncbi:efflux RND transporter permease subunit [Methylobacter sp. BBA5.1]|jgi:Cu(I)/Ag(I) efflux system membrane protein CusA/SilA|uniref:efflux RND transporter permease subunit n=1 Tax=Methylobacter sp. BBA5.1 TaxID=1495064 RepID=UPI0005600B57|nr:CusA/CzcA family heavy metal efflux RND transporter [Methylobacter sp. BBA5.1]
MVNEHNTVSVGPIQRVIAYCARNAFATLLLVAICAFWGYRALISTPLDAIPDLSDVQVIIYTDWPGRSPDLVEDQITYPLTTTLLAAPKVQFVRGQSFMGLSFVYVIFEEGTDIYWARSRVIEYLNSAAAKLPEAVRPTLGPDATGVGWVFEYALVDKSGHNNLAQLRSLQDFKLRYWLESVEGVAEVASLGGFEKEYQVTVDADKLATYGITINQVAQAIRRSNNDVGGRVLEIAGHEHIIRGRGYIHAVADIERIALGASKAGVPVTVGTVAQVSLGPALRRGLAELDGEGETVGGIVVMRYGEDALNVIERVKQRLEDIKKSLPQGVEIVTTYDRSDLIERAIATLKDTLIEEMIVVSLVIMAFLLHFRSALIAILTLPIAILLAFIPMSMQHMTANIMSLGGIAVAIGAMVDAAITLIENIHKRLENQEEIAESERRAVIIHAMQEVGPSIFFALLIITVSFLPVFALEGTEGRLFKPLAFTKTYSMGFAALLAVTLIPALSVLLIRGKIRGDKNRLTRIMIDIYSPVVHFALRFRGWVIGVSVLSLLLTVPVFFKLGNEFMPPLNEGSILYMPTALPGMSITEAGKVLQSMDRQLKTFPEVERVFGKIGRSTSPTDPAPLSMVETVITLKPMDQWRKDMSWDGLIAEMDATMRYPGMPNIWWMPIQTRTEMLATGIRAGLGIKVFGDDLATIESAALRIEHALQDDDRTRPFTRSAFAERLTGGYYLDFTIDRDKIARYGLTVDAVEDVISTAIGGLTVSQTIEGRARYGINLRYARDFRDNPEALNRVLVPTPDGAQIPLGQLARLEFVTGPPMLRNEDGFMVSFVLVDVKGIGIADYVDLARQVVHEKAAIPQGVRVEWAGQFKYFERAMAKLKVLVPLTLAIVFLMLFLNHDSIGETLIILLAIPFSLIGAVWLLYLLEYNLSIAVWVGMIALAGLAAEMGVLMLLYLDLSCRQRSAENRLQSRQDLTEAIVEGAARRIRPKLMTGMTTLIGLTPILWNTGTGADVMKRIAAPMVGGIISALLMVLIVFPAVYSYWKGWRLKS